MIIHLETRWQRNGICELFNEIVSYTLIQNQKLIGSNCS